jgi:hypothetical protein
VRSLGFYVGAIVVSGLLLGLVVAPIRTMRAWRAAADGQSLFQPDAPTHEQLLGQTIGELRTLLGLPSAGLYTGYRGLHSRAPTRHRDS